MNKLLHTGLTLAVVVAGAFTYSDEAEASQATGFHVRHIISNVL